jgi:hypothetical protein
MQDRPTAAELLATLTEYLEGEVLPNVEGTLRYHTLVAANLTKMLRREAELYPAAAVREQAALTDLLGAAGDQQADLATLNAELARRLRNGEGDRAFELRCWDLLSAANADKLAISKPGYDRYDTADEVRPGSTADEVRPGSTADEVRPGSTAGEG